ncbi:LemA family protein [Faecalicatena sp. Marseille-Q4148]|nr:LemA family protein [Faecalicatena sp. Marseille-Q4148]
MKAFIIVLLFIVMTIVIIGAVFVGMYNRLVKARISCEEAFSTMDVYMKKRSDLIPNLVEAVKSYTAYEAGTLEKVIAARNAGASALTMGEMRREEQQISGALHQISALAEGYPDLKANENYRELMSQLKASEEDIAQSRKYYNAVVREYNALTMTVPTNLIAGMFGFEKREMFEAHEEEQEMSGVAF